MKNQKVDTLLGAIILIIIAITVGVFVWKVEKGQEQDELQAPVINVKKTDGQQSNQQNVASGEKDDRGCLIASGNFWCEEKQTCVQDWSKSCGNADISDVSRWDEFNSKKHNLKFSVNFKYPSVWFNTTGIAGESFVTFPFYSKDEYKNICHPADRGVIHCNSSGYIVSASIFSSAYIPRKVNYVDEKKYYITIGGHKGVISEGIVNDSDDGLIAKNGEKEIRVLFSNVNGSNFEIIMKISDDSDRDIFNKVISTLNFPPSDEAKSFSYEKGVGFYGTLTFSGYLDIKKRICNPDDMCNKTVDYASMIITCSNNKAIYDFINDNKGNSFVGDKSIGLGCYEKDANRIYSLNSADSGQVENIISGDELKKILQSNKNNPVKIKLTKPYFSGGGGAPECYSHFRSFKIIP